MENLNSETFFYIIYRDNFPGSSLTPGSAGKRDIKGTSTPSPKKGGRRDDGWKEVSRKSRKLTIPGKCVNKVLGRDGVHITAIREVSGANIDIDKTKGSNDRNVTIKYVLVT